MNKRSLGAQYEALAAAELMKQGYTILEKNYACRGGEIDIIARDGRTLVFVEVKYRRNSDFGHPEDAVDLRKRQKIIFTARRYMYLHGYDRGNVPCRFDVVSVEGNRVRIIQDAFWM